MKRFICLLLLALTIEYYYPFKMKKARVNIGPSIGSTEEIYVDIRFDAEQYKLYNCDDDDIIECIEANCVRVHEKIEEVSPKTMKFARAYDRVVDIVCEYYKDTQ